MTTEEMIHDYEKRAKTLKDSMDAKIAELSNSPTGETYQEIRGNMANLREYKVNEKRKMFAEQSDLGSLFANIQSKLKSMNRPPYSPPADLTLESLDSTMEQLSTTERQYRSSLNAKLRAVLDALRHAFADPANVFYGHLQQYKTVLATPVESDLQGSLNFFREKQAEFINTLEGELPRIKVAEDECLACNVEDNEYSDHS